MAVYDDVVQSQWDELKGGLRQHWSRLSLDDIAQLSGKQAELVLALRRRYGYGEGQALMEINAWVSDHDRESGSTTGRIAGRHSTHTGLRRSYRAAPRRPHGSRGDGADPSFKG